MSLFGTSGIRGDAEVLFTNQFCFDIGRSFAKFISLHDCPNAVAIGMDPRGSSPRILKAISSGLIFEKCEVYGQGATPVPSMNFVLLADPALGGSIMVSGSHIQPKLNGVKFFFNREEILKNNESEIEKIYLDLKERVTYRENLTDFHEEEKAKTDYQEYLLSLANKDIPNWSVVVDPGDGAQSDVMPYVLKTLGLNVIEMNSTIQGEFYARDTEVPGDFSSLCERVKSEKSDFGVGYDSDGDRVVFVDEKGNFIPGDFSCALVAKNQANDSVVTPINTSQVIDHIGKKVYRTKVGSPYVVSKMIETKSSFGFEGNGGGIFSEMHSRDGGRMTIEVINIMANERKSLFELISILPRFFVVKDKIPYRWELKDKVILEAKEKFKGIRIEEVDGLKIWIDKQTWILFRSSMNAPEFRVFAESTDQKKAVELLNQGMTLVNDVVRKSKIE